MTKEIVEAVGVLEREKGISADRLMAALEDALLSAYKKTPEAAKYARVEVDRGNGDFRVSQITIAVGPDRDAGAAHVLYNNSNNEYLIVFQATGVPGATGFACAATVVLLALALLAAFASATAGKGLGAARSLAQ